jgi:hypothetical protein
MGLRYRKQGIIFFFPRQVFPLAASNMVSPISQHCFTTCSEHHSLVLYTLKDCLDRRPWKYKEGFLYFSISHSDKTELSMSVPFDVFVEWRYPRYRLLHSFTSHISVKGNFKSLEKGINSFHTKILRGRINSRLLLFITAPVIVPRSYLERGK